MLVKLKEKKLSHLDIKPCNILLNSDEVKLADFGTSKQTKNTMTNTSVKGTGYYMSPELVEI